VFGYRQWLCKLDEPQLFTTYGNGYGAPETLAKYVETGQVENIMEYTGIFKSIESKNPQTSLSSHSHLVLHYANVR